MFKDLEKALPSPVKSLQKLSILFSILYKENGQEKYDLDTPKIDMFEDLEKDYLIQLNNFKTTNVVFHIVQGEQ